MTLTKRIGQSTTPWSWYSDPAILESELERIFRCSWQYAGHLGELPGRGSYFASATGPIPIVVTLDADGTLRGFVNVCRHRGAIVAEEARKRGTIQCPYHAWTYGLDGSLRAAPRAGDDPAFDASRMGLLPVSVGTWGPFVFANPDPHAEPLQDALETSPRWLPSTGSTSSRCGSTGGCTTRSTRTGRSRWRTSSSATTARSTIHGWCR